MFTRMQFFISHPTLHSDDCNAPATTSQLYKIFFGNRKWSVNNENSGLLRAKGLLLNQSDQKILSKFWRTKVWSNISNNRLVETEYLFRLEFSSSSKRNDTSLASGFLENFRGRNKIHQIVARLIASFFSFQSQLTSDYQYVDILQLLTIWNKVRLFISYSSSYF